MWKEVNWLLQKFMFETFLLNLFLNLAPTGKNNFFIISLLQACFSSQKQILQNYLKIV